MHRKIIVSLLFSCANGIPLGLIVSTLNAWLEIAGISKTTIGFFSLVGVPYVLKFIWSPLIDHLPLPLLTKKLGRRTSWLIVSQLLLSFSIIKLSSLNPVSETYNLALWAFIVSVLAATQETITDAYRVEILEKNEQGIGATSAALGNNIGLALSGGGTLLTVDILCKDFQICENFTNWKISYIIFALTIFIATIASLIIGEPQIQHQKKPNYRKLKNIFSECIIKPFSDFKNHTKWFLILMFVLLYRTCDSFISPMTNPFLLNMGFSLTEIALVVKTFGFFATTFGAILGGALTYHIGIIKSLFVAGLAQMISNAMFIAQAKAGYNVTLLYFSIAAENIGGSMAISVFTTYVARLCSSKHNTATQYSFLMSFSCVNYFFAASFSGWVVESFGWVTLFSTSIALGIPPLIMLSFLGNNKN
ncbi:MAG: MFS transporter [Rickettsiaceae bacterium H1]|nr:MFS transporter [Rickettsiaceae bacterium H1]